MEMEEAIVLYALVFLVLFLIGGVVASLSFPEFPGRFFVGGIVVGAFGTGAGKLVINAIVHR